MPAPRIVLTSLTGLRFFAALAVVLYHVKIYFTPLGDGLAIFGYGYTGVSFFFMLSGFVLAWSHRMDVPAAQFFWHRFGRIWPLHVLTMILAMWIPVLGASSPTTWSAMPFVLTLTQAWLPGSSFLTAFNGVSWSLSCEVFFYVSFPVLFKVLARQPRFAGPAGIVFGALILVGIALSTSTSVPTADYLLGTMPLYRMGEFVLGMCLAMAMTRGWRPTFRLVHALALTGLLTLALYAVPLILTGISGPLPVIGANLVMIPGFMALIATSACGDLAGTSGVLASKALVRLGQWSFALYLVHELVIREARIVLGGMSVQESIAAAFLVVVVSIVLSGLLHEFIEKPAEKWLRPRRPFTGPRGPLRYTTQRNE